MADLNSVPEGWNELRLGDASTLITKGTTPKKYASSGVNFVKVESLSSAGALISKKFAHIDCDTHQNQKRSQLENGDILFSIAGSLGRLAVIKNENLPANTNQALAIVRLKKDAISTAFCVQQLKGELVQFELKKLQTVGAQPNLSLQQVSDIQLVFPPLPEQQKIAAILTSVDEVIEKTQAQINKLKDLKTGMMQELLTRGIGINGKPHTEFKDSPVGKIPKRWNVHLVGDLFDIQLGKMLSKASKITDTPCVYLGNKNVQWGKVDLSHLEKMDFNDREKSKFCLLKGDLLVCEGGDVGRTAIWQEEISNCYYQKAIHRLRTKNSSYEPLLFMEYIKHAKENGLLNDFVSRTSIAHLTKEKLTSIPLPVPEMDEQKKIVELLTGINIKIEKIENKYNKNMLIKKALMQDLLTGKVRVNID